jgi:hypothetical protein
MTENRLSVILIIIIIFILTYMYIYMYNCSITDSKEEGKEEEGKEEGKEAFYEGDMKKFHNYFEDEAAKKEIGNNLTIIQNSNKHLLDSIDITHQDNMKNINYIVEKINSKISTQNKVVGDYEDMMINYEYIIQNEKDTGIVSSDRQQYPKVVKDFYDYYQISPTYKKLHHTRFYYGPDKLNNLQNIILIEYDKLDSNRNIIPESKKIIRFEILANEIMSTTFPLTTIKIILKNKDFSFITDNDDLEMIELLKTLGIEENKTLYLHGNDGKYSLYNEYKMLVLPLVRQGGIIMDDISTYPELKLYEKNFRLL